MITVKNVAAIQLSLPPLELQREILAEIEGYQRIIDGARAVLTSYRPYIPVDPDWETIPIGELSKVESGHGFPVDQQGLKNEEIPFLKVSDMNLPGNEVYIKNWNHTISPTTLHQLRAKSYPAGTIIFPKIGAAIATNKKRILTKTSTYDNNVMGIIADEVRLSGKFLYYWLCSFNLSKWASTSEPPSMRKSVVEMELIPLPLLEIQKNIVAELDAEQVLVDGNRDLINRFEKKIDTAIGRIWGKANENSA